MNAHREERTVPIADLAERLAARLADIPPEVLNAPRPPRHTGDGDPACATCAGLGYVGAAPSAPVGDPDYGKLTHCPACRADEETRRAERAYRKKMDVIERYGITPRPTSRFDTFRTASRATSVRAAAAAAVEFASSETGKWLVLYGPPGTGKTHLCMAVANAAHSQRRQVLLATTPGLLDLLRAGYDRGDYDELLRITKNVPVLILDDLGTENTTPWAREKLFDIINHRYNHVPDLKVMITMNIEPRELEPRIASRVMDIQSVIINVSGSDYRIERRNHR